MKIVTYNINGLRPRVLQFGSLRKLLDSLDADIICFQETKLSRQDLTADLVIADGYECFFSCTRTSEKGRVGYSGVATFCRVNSAFSSNEVALPLAAEEGFTGVLGSSKGSRNSEGKAEGLEEFTREELLKVDGEGRCVITDHGHFVLFNIYGPRADSEDAERIQFKHTFYMILQKRCEVLLHQGKRVVILGDLNIAPAAIDSCNPGPDFAKNKFRIWFRSMLVENGGSFFDVYRVKHPDKRDAYTQWCQNTGAEEFNYGSRIDHILCATSCLHEDAGTQDHNFVTCHVKECDIMTQFKRARPGSSPRWKGGRNVKLEGSDHAPVYMSLMEIPNILQHSTPSLSARYAPEVRGIQQTIVSLLMKRQSTEQTKMDEVSSSFAEESFTIESSAENPSSTRGISYGSMRESEGSIHRIDGISHCSNETDNMIASGSGCVNSTPSHGVRKKAKQSSQLSLKSFFRTNPKPIVGPGNVSDGALLVDKDINQPEEHHLKDFTCTANEGEVNSQEVEKSSNFALMEWQRIQQMMRDSVPLCKGHREPCVARIVKKAGPTLGRRFYVCARAEGPASNPETNCGYFKWAASKPKGQG